MPKVPGVTRDLLQKQILELLEGIGIPAKEWIGKGGSTVRRLVTKTELSPFKPNMLSAMSQQKKTFGDALDAFSNEAKFIMNANDQELMNFKNNIIDYTDLGGKPGGSGGEGLASMMKTLDDLGSEAKNLKTTAEEMKDLALKNIKDLEDSLKHGGDPFKVPDKTSVGGSMYAEGNIRTAVREFMRTEIKEGRLKPINEFDKQVLEVYGSTTESDPITMFRKYYGEDALDAIDNISSVFEKGESFKHYEQLLRENVDEKILTLKTKGVGEFDSNVKAAEDIRTKVETEEIDTLKPDPDDIPFYAGGRVGLKLGGDTARKAIIKKLKDWVNTSLKENKGVASMFKKQLNDSADLDDLQFETVLDDFVTTADEMSGAKINSNKSVQNKRDLLRAIEEWNKNPKHTFYRGVDKKYTDDFTKDMSEESKASYQETKDKIFAEHVDRGWNNFLRPGDTKKDVFTPENYGSFYSSDPYTARSYAHAKLGSLPEIKKIKLTTEEVQKGLERNFENNPFAYTEDVMLEKELADKAKRDWWESIKAKWEFPDNWSFAEGGRVGLKYGTKKLFSFTKKQLKEAVENIFPTGDRKYDAELVSESLVENNPKKFKNRLREDLNDSEYSEIYGTALDALDTFNAEAKALMKPKPKGQIWKDEKGETAGIAMGFSESEMGGLDKAMQKGMALSNAMKAMGMDPTSSNQTIKFDQLVSEGMIGFPKDIKEQIIRAKYGAVVDERLMNNLLIDDNPQRLAQVMGTIDEGLIMQEKGMAPDEIIESIKSSLDRKPNAAGGGVGSMFRGV